jgi:hypothetical protein
MNVKSRSKRESKNSYKILGGYEVYCFNHDAGLLAQTKILTLFALVRSLLQLTLWKVQHR